MRPAACWWCCAVLCGMAAPGPVPSNNGCRLHCACLHVAPLQPSLAETAAVLAGIGAFLMFMAKHVHRSVRRGFSKLDSLDCLTAVGLMSSNCRRSLCATVAAVHLDCTCAC